jgi:hypothetical protein
MIVSAVSAVTISEWLSCKYVSWSVACATLLAQMVAMNQCNNGLFASEGCETLCTIDQAGADAACTDSNIYAAYSDHAHAGPCGPV